MFYRRMCPFFLDQDFLEQLILQLLSDNLPWIEHKEAKKFSISFCTKRVTQVLQCAVKLFLIPLINTTVFKWLATSGKKVRRKYCLENSWRL